MFISIRKSFTAVTVLGSNDFGSAICQTINTSLGVCANAALETHIAEATTAPLIKFEIMVMLALLPLKKVIVIYHDKFE